MTGAGRSLFLSLHNLYYQTHAGIPLLAALALIASCSPASQARDSAAPAAAAEPAAPPAPAAPPPAPPGPLAMPLAGAEARHAGAATPLSPGSAALIDPASTFEIRVGAPARDARLVLVDSQDVLVPATVEAEVGAESRFALVPLEPLRPGSAYWLRLEGLGGRLVRSDGGRSFEPLVLPLQITGSPPPRAPPKKAPKKRPD